MKIECHKGSDRRGFTLVETMMSLMIFSISITIICIVLQGLHHEFSDSSTTDFYLYLNVLETHNYKLKHCYSQRLILDRERKVYNIRLINHKLVMSTTKGGYIPILDNVRSVNWRKRNNAVVSQVRMGNGECLNGRSWLQNA